MPPRRPTKGADSFFCFCSDTHMVPETVTSAGDQWGSQAAARTPPCLSRDVSAFWLRIVSLNRRDARRSQPRVCHRH
jgi:hypothetical protein